MITVHVPFSPKIHKLSQWNEVCANIVERFGLPGGKYTTEVTEDYMNFNFVDEQDGLMCQLLVSDHV